MAKRYLIWSAMFLTASMIGFIAGPAAAASLGGSWSGNGYIKPRDGKSERVRCRVSYTQMSNTVFSVSARCASASASIRQTGELLKIRPNVFVGDFYSSEYDIRGRIRVVISGSSQTVTLSSRDGSGRLSLRKR